MTEVILQKLRLATFVFLILLLSLSPVSSIVAQGLGHAFSGTVKIDGGNAAVGTVISARVDGTEYGSSTVTTPGQYALIVQGDIAEGTTIHFYVDGQEADQTFPFHDGWTTELDLTVTTGLPVPKYALTITTDPGVGGAATDETGGSPYAAGAAVSIKAVANPGYGFVGWTALAGDFDDATAEETTFTMPAQNVTVTAHFGVAYELAMAADPVSGGDAIDVGAKGAYAAGVEVSINAVANPGYGFVGWTAPAGDFDDETAEETTFTMPAENVTVTAHFGVAYALAMAADPVAGGDAIDVAAKGAYAAGAEVSIKAEPAAGYGFVDWTADPTVTFDNETAEETTFTMPAQAVTVTAHFEVVYALAMAAAPPAGGDVIDVAAEGAYAAGTVVNITAAAATGYRFVNWAATAGEFGNVTAAETTFTMPAQAITVIAHFEEVSPSEVPTVTTQAATDVSSYSGSVHMSYTLGVFSSVEVRFACKRSTDPTWFYTTWVSRTTDGTYTEVLTGLVSQTEYEFKAQLKYNGTVIEGATRQFTTAAGASMGLNDLLGSLGCFIATAAYGTPTAEQIDVLREFRDVVLLESTVGSQFVVLYYRLSPPIADFIARSDLLRTLVRGLLVDPIVWIVEATGDIWRN
jgi:uncharacterized repeat protein (TIGR02543 family)